MRAQLSFTSDDSHNLEGRHATFRRDKGSTRSQANGLRLLQGMPKLDGGGTVLRRHGDEVERLPGGYYIALGRCDDTMNLGGIKVMRRS